MNKKKEKEKLCVLKSLSKHLQGFKTAYFIQKKIEFNLSNCFIYFA